MALHHSITWCNSTLAKFLILLFALPCYATSWADKTVIDPLNDSSSCQVHVPTSSGTYIYYWPEKHDQVFWPMTDENGIWFCESSGFTAFIQDFDKVSNSEKEAIKEYLKEKFSHKGDIHEKLKLLEGIYGIRQKDSLFQNMLLRVFARWYQNLGDTTTANIFRQKALISIEQRLETRLNLPIKLSYLYLATLYNRKFGNVEKSNAYLSRLNLELTDTNNISMDQFRSYYCELVEEIPRLRLLPSDKDSIAVPEICSKQRSASIEYRHANQSHKKPLAKNSFNTKYCNERPWTVECKDFHERLKY